MIVHGENQQGKTAIDLGLAISGWHVRRGIGLSCVEIAAFCGCSRERIRQIEARALRKLRNRLSCPGYRELMETLYTR